MREVALSCEVRTAVGKGPNRRARQEGRIPAIIYGKGTQPVPISVNARELSRLLGQGLSGKLIKLAIKDGEAPVEKTAVLKEVQRDFREGRVLHVDFQEVSLTDKITTKIPVVLVGDDRRKSDGGILEHQLWELEIQAIPTEIPEKIEVDVSGLTIGDTLKVSDLKVDPGIKILTDGDEPVVTVAVPTKAEAEVEAPKAAPGEAGAEAGTAAGTEGEGKREA